MTTKQEIILTDAMVGFMLLVGFASLLLILSSPHLP
jgi:hypothetical protein